MVNMAIPVLTEISPVFATTTTIPNQPASAHLSLSSFFLMIPRRAGLRAGKDNIVEVMVRIQAPDAPAGQGAQRPPQAMALVIDRSGSMSGRPLEEAKRCAEYVLGKLRPSDAVSLVKFDNRVQRLWPAAPWAAARRSGRPSRASTPAATPTFTAAGRKARTRWPMWPARG